MLILKQKRVAQRGDRRATCVLVVLALCTCMTGGRPFLSQAALDADRAVRRDRVLPC